MQNRKPNLWGELTSSQNLYLAFEKAARGKRGRNCVASFERTLRLRCKERTSAQGEGFQ